MKLENFDDICAYAECFANNAMRDSGNFPPTLFLIGSDGPFILASEPFADEQDKNAFAACAQVMAIAHDATGWVMATVGWRSSAKPGEMFDDTETLFEAPDRQEVVILMGESKNGQMQKFMAVIRSDNGIFLGFRESDAPALNKLEGRFAQILPTEAPNKARRKVAMAMLKVTNGYPFTMGRIITNRTTKELIDELRTEAEKALVGGIIVDFDKNTTELVLANDPDPLADLNSLVNAGGEAVALCRIDKCEDRLSYSIRPLKEFADETWINDYLAALGPEIVELLAAEAGIKVEDIQRVRPELN